MVASGGSGVLFFRISASSSNRPASKMTEITASRSSANAPSTVAAWPAIVSDHRRSSFPSGLAPGRAFFAWARDMPQRRDSKPLCAQWLRRGGRPDEQHRNDQRELLIPSKQPQQRSTVTITCAIVRTDTGGVVRLREDLRGSALRRERLLEPKPTRRAVWDQALTEIERLLAGRPKAMESDSLVLENGLLRGPEPAAERAGAGPVRLRRSPAHSRDGSPACPRARRPGQRRAARNPHRGGRPRGRVAPRPSTWGGGGRAPRRRVGRVRNFACGFAFDVGRERRTGALGMVDLQNEVAHLRGEGYRPEGGARPLSPAWGGSAGSRPACRPSAAPRTSTSSARSWPSHRRGVRSRWVTRGGCIHWRAAAESHRQLCALFDAVRVFPRSSQRTTWGRQRGWTGELRDALDVVAAHLNSVNPEALDAEAALATISPTLRSTDTAT